MNANCVLNKCFGGLKILSGNKYYDSLDNNKLTLDYIFKNASNEELEAIVHSIYNRIRNYEEDYKLSDKILNEIAKGLRKPQ